jgi:hypothetical protein
MSSSTTEGELLEYITLDIKRTAVITISFLLVFFALCPSFAEPLPIESKNWMSHPEIKRIRSLYNEIEESVKKGRLSKKPVPMDCPSEESFIEATFYEDPSGIVRKYQLSGGSYDSEADASYYYDKAGKLRFVFQSLRAVNGTDMETRTYFYEKGNILYQDERLKKGPGWAGGFPESIQNPREHAASLCR